MLKVLSALVYSHMWIALCACAMVAQTFHHYGYDWTTEPLVWLTFGGTLFIYAIHRIVGLNKLKALNFDLNPRYISIESSRNFVLIFGVLGAIVAALAFFRLSYTTQLYLTLPTAISVLYVSPILGNKKRLRDVGALKIFLIALTYALVSVVLVTAEIDHPLDNGIWLMFIEKFIFILAITLPFDLRDLEIDQLGSARTIPMIIGYRKTIFLSLGLLWIAKGVVWANPQYDFTTATTLTLCYFITAGLVGMVNRKRSDLYYSFGLDGTMIIQMLALYLMT